MDVCPQCGYSEIQVNKKFSHAVYPFVDPTTGKVDGMYNTDEEFITVQPKGSSKQTKLQRQDKWEEVKAQEAAKKEEAAKVAKSAPVSTTTTPTK